MFSELQTQLWAFMAELTRYKTQTSEQNPYKTKRQTNKMCGGEMYESISCMSKRFGLNIGG